MLLHPFHSPAALSQPQAHQLHPCLPMQTLASQDGFWDEVRESKAFRGGAKDGTGYGGVMDNGVTGFHMGMTGGDGVW